VSARNIHHDAVVQALTKDGWTITDDPLHLRYGGRDLYVDLGAERSTIGATKGEQQIAVEIHSFLLASPVRDIQEAVGQYAVYRTVLAVEEPHRVLYLAVPDDVYDDIINVRFGQLIVSSLQLRLVVFNVKSATVLKWIN
jgi:hypothetical protein